MPAISGLEHYLIVRVDQDGNGYEFEALKNNRYEVFPEWSKLFFGDLTSGTYGATTSLGTVDPKVSGGFGENVDVSAGMISRVKFLYDTNNGGTYRNSLVKVNTNTDTNINYDIVSYIHGVLSETQVSGVDTAYTYNTKIYVVNDTDGTYSLPFDPDSDSIDDIPVYDSTGRTSSDPSPSNGFDTIRDIVNNNHIDPNYNGNDRIYTSNPTSVNMKHIDIRNPYLSKPYESANADSFPEWELGNSYGDLPLDVSDIVTLKGSGSRATSRDDISTYDTVYQAMVANTTYSPSPTINNATQFNNSTTYNIDDVIYLTDGSDNIYYISLNNSNTGNAPFSSTANWRLADLEDGIPRNVSASNIPPDVANIVNLSSISATGYVEWNNATTYSEDDIRIYNDNLYIAITDTTAGDEPDTSWDQWNLVHVYNSIDSTADGSTDGFVNMWSFNGYANDWIDTTDDWRNVSNDFNSLTGGAIFTSYETEQYNIYEAETSIVFEPTQPTILAYDNTATYDIDHVISFGSSSRYISLISDNDVSSVPFDEENRYSSGVVVRDTSDVDWQSIIEYPGISGVWDNDTSYGIGTGVSVGGDSYLSTQSSPATWNAERTYGIGDDVSITVANNVLYFRAIADNTDRNPAEVSNVGAGNSWDTLDISPDNSDGTKTVDGSADYWATFNTDLTNTVYWRPYNPSTRTDAWKELNTPHLSDIDLFFNRVQLSGDNNVIGTDLGEGNSIIANSVSLNDTDNSLEIPRILFSNGARYTNFDDDPDDELTHDRIGVPLQFDKEATLTVTYRVQVRRS